MTFFTELIDLFVCEEIWSINFNLSLPPNNMTRLEINVNINQDPLSPAQTVKQSTSSHSYTRLSDSALRPTTIVIQYVSAPVQLLNLDFEMVETSLIWVLLIIVMECYEIQHDIMTPYLHILTVQTIVFTRLLNGKISRFPITSSSNKELKIFANCKSYFRPEIFEDSWPLTIVTTGIFTIKQCFL